MSEEFLGPSYNLLSKNCNHFTNTLCHRMTSRSAPSWLNRAAGIGVALPCVVPREWIAPPDHDTADGELLEDDEYDERSTMLRSISSERVSMAGTAEQHDRATTTDVPDQDSPEESRGDGSGKGEGLSRDTSGRIMPASERARSLPG